ncbi:MAG: hypothetical protein ACI3YK_05170 [Eubacteriales bacterium]
MAFLGIFLVLYLIVSIFCAVKESKVTGLYKAFGVYGRVYAYFALSFIVGIVAFFVSVIACIVSGEFSGILYSFFYLIIGAIGVYLYWRAYRKCPDFLKKKLIPSMILSGLGVGLKVCLFFIGAVWKMFGPQEVVDSDGKTLLVYDGYVYDTSGNRIGVASADRQSYIKTE